jgi:hypothetical protein
MAMCLLIGAAMEERNMVPVSTANTQVLSQQALKQLEGKLSTKEMNYEVARRAVKGLAVSTQVLAVKFAARALSPGTTMELQECSNKDAYESIQESFTELASNISAHNASLYARELELKADADAANEAWMESESAYRTAVAAKESAGQAATYAAGMYSKYETAVSTGQAEYDTEKPKLDGEILQLNAELPVLQEVLGLVTSLSGAAAAKANHKAILKLAQEKVAGLVPPKADKRLDGSILKLKSILAAADTAGTAASMAAVIQGLQAQMTSRIAEIQAQIGRMEGKLNEDKASKAEWEKKMVDLSDAHDEAQNKERTADLTRNSLGGTFMVKDEAYQNFHASFEGEVSKLSDESAAVTTILGKINDFIASC